MMALRKSSRAMSYCIQHRTSLPSHSIFFYSLFSSTSTLPSSTHAASKVESIPVIIAGGGPVGLTTAYYLSSYGVSSILLERSTELTTHPRAHFINHRTMEVFRGMDGLSSHVRRIQPPLEQWKNFIYCTELTKGTLLGVVDHFKGQKTSHAPLFSPEPVAHLAQHKLLPLMMTIAKNSPGVNIRMGHKVIGFDFGTSDDKSNGAVRIEVENVSERTTYAIEAQYVVAADGAHSSIRKSLNIPMVGPGTMQNLINIHFISKPLGRELKTQDRQGMLYFVFGPGVIAVLVGHNLDDGEFVAQIPYFPPLQTQDDFTTDVCTAIIRRAAGDASLPVQIKTVRAWAMSAATAETYVSPNKRVILAGDAAHVVPPSGAMGMNTGVQDAHNLAWKLALAINRPTEISADHLLQSYEAERKPVAESNMRLSVANFHEALAVARTMGLDYGVANTFSDILSSPALSKIVPESIRRRVLETGIAAGRAASAPMAALRKKELDALFCHGETLRLQYPKEDLGFVYHNNNDKKAIVCYSEGILGDSERVADYMGPKPRDAPYCPTMLPGARYPNIALRLLQPGSLHHTNKSITSSIDLWPAAGLDFCIVLNARAQGLKEWLAAVAEYNAALGSGDGLHLCPVVLVDNSDVQKINVDKTVAVCMIDQDDAGEKGTGWVWNDLGQSVGHGWEEIGVIVRPDGHVGWRGGADIDGKKEKLEQAMSTLLGLEK